MKPTFIRQNQVRQKNTFRWLLLIIAFLAMGAFCGYVAFGAWNSGQFSYWGRFGGGHQVVSKAISPLEFWIGMSFAILGCVSFAIAAVVATLVLFQARATREKIEAVYCSWLDRSSPAASKSLVIIFFVIFSGALLYSLFV